MKYVRIEALYGVLLIGLVAGCGGGGDPSAYKGPTATVSGKVTLDGKPVPKGVTVRFQGTEKSYLAVGVVQDDGKYELKYKGNKNVPAIKYTVTVSPPSEASGKPLDPAAAMATATTVSTGQSMGASTPPKTDGPIPFKYGSISTSGLIYTIDKGAVTKDIELKN